MLVNCRYVSLLPFASYFFALTVYFCICNNVSMYYVMCNRFLSYLSFPVPVEIGTISFCRGGKYQEMEFVNLCKYEVVDQLVKYI